MSTPPVLLSLAALPVAPGGDPHLRPGTHLRWTSHPALGLPAAPVDVTRMPLDAQTARRCPPQPLTWTRGTTGTVLTVPFILAGGERAIGRPVLGSSDAAASIRVAAPGIPAERITGGLRTRGGYRAITHATGDGHLAVTGLDEVHVTGPGTVVEAWWRSLDCLRAGGAFELVEHVGTPFGRLPRYDPRPVSDPPGAARERVRRAAPLLVDLYDAIGPGGPVSPAARTAAEEERRVAQLVEPDLRERYQRLFAGGATPPSQRTSPETIAAPAGGSVGNVEMPLMFFLHAALQDPSLARWAGHATLDERPLAPGGHLYRIRMLFDPANFDTDDLDLQRHERWLRDYRADRTGLALSGTGVLLDAYALAVPGVAPPALHRVTPNGDATATRWISGGPTARRLATVSFRPPLGATRHAIYRRSADTGQTEALNPLHRGGRFRLGILADTTLEADGSARATHHDPAAPGGACTYGLAASDAFGRWSAWTTVALAEGAWQPLPVPVPQAVYRPAAREPVDARRRAGRVGITLRLPARLPPGVPGLSQAVVRVLDGAGEAVSERTVRVAAGGDPVALELRGPALGRAKTASIEVTAQFRHGELSSELGRTSLLAADPRPPRPLTLAPRLQWATQPDARDRALVRLAWDAPGEHAGYRVYRASTRTIEPWLRSLRARGRPALRALQAPRIRAAEVVAILDAFVPELPRSAFELLTHRLVEPDAFRRCVMETTLPGRSRLVYLYRICAVAANQVEEDWAAAPGGYWVAVPASVRPQPPQLEAREARDAPGAIRLTITVPRAAPVGALRILRTADPARAEPGTMAVIHEASLEVGALDGGEDAGRVIHVEHLDRGATAHMPRAALRPWSRYTYRAQVRAASAAGEPPGIWSDPSETASAVVVPAAPPPAPALTATRTAGDVTLAWRIPGLDAPVTALGAFAVRVLRARPDEPVPREIARMRAAADQGHVDEDAPARGAQYWVELRDPAGRRRLSGVAEVAEVAEVGPR